MSMWSAFLMKRSVLQFLGDIDDLLGWFGEIERKIQSAPPISIDPTDLRAHLQEHKVLQEDIANQKSKARDIMTGVKRLRRESSCDEDPAIAAKLDELRAQSDAVIKLSSDRMGQLEQAMPLAAHFQEAHTELLNWLADVEQQVAEYEAQPLALNPPQIKEQQDAIKVIVMFTKSPLLPRTVNRKPVFINTLTSE